MDEIIPKKEVKQLESMVDKEKFPATFEYLLLHGLTSAVSPWNITGKFKTPEDVYMECLKRKVRWEELLKKPPDDVLL